MTQQLMPQNVDKTGGALSKRALKNEGNTSGKFGMIFRDSNTSTRSEYVWFSSVIA